MGLPEAVRAAAMHRPPTIPPRHGGTRHPSRGDLRLVRAPYGGDGTPRIGLILEVAPGGNILEIALVHSSADLATSFDGVVAGKLVGTTFPMVIQTDLRGMVWSDQVRRLVGTVSPATLEAVSDLVGGSSDAPDGIEIGTPLLGPRDRRWAFKEAEGAALDALCGDCTTELIRGQEPWLMGRELLMPELLTRSDSLEEVLEELGHWLRTRDVRIDLETALWLEDAGAFEVSMWLDAGLDLDLFAAVTSAVEAAIMHSRPGPEPWSRSLRGPEVKDEEVAQYQLVHVLGRPAGMVTA
jgi:hypothetical protein